MLLQAITLGLTGVPSGSPEADWAAELTKTLVPAERVQVHSDAFTALKGAHAGRPGVIVISGTGMIAMGLDMRGEVGRCGGWGWVLGDEGSAFAIGRQGLRAALNAYDGAASPTVLVNLFLEHFQVARMPDIKRIYMNSEFRAPEFGRLAAVVSTAARRGDEVAKNIVDQSSRALAQSVLALVSRLDFGGQEVPVAPFGGAFDHIHGLMEGFKEHLKRVPQPRLRIVSPEFNPAVGALIIALESCGASLGDVVPAIRDYYAAAGK
jgi:N-acetylglucosamine kinase-like BadF-type ATPase